ncbi:MAG TPA: MFS transporter [Anaerolineaceae bacterium]|nr:MFS transporter [Anaerolineaceae bacterium]
MAGSFVRNRYTWLSYLMLAFYAYFLNILGPITPYLKDQLGLSYTVSSLHFTAFAFGMVISGLCGFMVIKRFGKINSLWIGSAGMVLGALILVSGKTPLLTIGASFLMGLIGSLILVVVPSILSDKYGENRGVALSEANTISSFVSTGAPLMVGVMVSLANSWQMALVIVALAPLLMRFVFRNIESQSSASIQFDSKLTPTALPPLYWLFWLAIVLAVSIEFCMVFWSADFLENGLGLSKINAAQAVSLFLAGMILGRLAGSRLVNRITNIRLVLLAILVAAAGFFLYWKATNALPGLVGLFVTGLGIANLYPIILSMAIGASNGNNGLAGARATLASGVAIFSLPLVLGRLADAVKIQQAYGIVALLLFGVFVIIGIAGFLAQPKRILTQ